MQNAEKVVLDREDLRRTLVRIAHEIVEKNAEEALAIVGIHTRGAILAERIHTLVGELTGESIPLGDLDISFYRDDIEARAPDAQPVVLSSHLDFELEGRTVVLVDDVLFTGRTVRAAIDALFDYGRPQRVQLAVLADRGHRELPIRADYVGKNLPTSRDERVFVRLEEHDEVDEVAIGLTEKAAASAARERRGPVRHLLAIEDLDRAEIERIMERADSFAEVGRRDIKKVPTLRGRTVVSLFYESSTRTSASFELAAKRLSADLVSIKASGSSVDKGESLKDTIATLSAYEPEAIVIRSPHAGAAKLVAGWTDASVVNAGDGKHEHPSQALLDVYTLRGRIGELEGKRIWIVGDVLHSRVARSSALAFRLMGAEVTLCGPPTLIPRGAAAALGCEVSHDISGLGDADVVYALRMQRERMGESFVPSHPRVRDALPDRRPPARAAPAPDAPRARQPRRGARPRRDRRPQLADHRAGEERAGRPDGDPLRAARRRRAPARRPAPRTTRSCRRRRRSGSPRDAAPISSLDWRGRDVAPERDLVLRSVTVLDPRAGIEGPHDVVIREGRVAELAAPGAGEADDAEVVEAEGLHAVPAFFDPHVHLRTPGREDKEDIETGTRAAAAGGYCGVLGDGEHRAARGHARRDRVAARARRRRRLPAHRLPRDRHPRDARRGAQRHGGDRRRRRRRLLGRRPPDPKRRG